MSNYEGQGPEQATGYIRGTISTTVLEIGNVVVGDGGGGGGRNDSFESLVLSFELVNSSLVKREADNRRQETIS